MGIIQQACSNCQSDVSTVFDPNTGTRTVVIITGDMFVTDCCFVADEIQFINNGRLIFMPASLNDTGGQHYCPQYTVICRKLSVRGGHKPVTVDPCNPGDPGSAYQGNNVITWKDRLVSAAGGQPPSPGRAADGQGFDPNVYQDQGQGSNGQNGGNGTGGVAGNNGGGGRSAPNFVLVVLEIDMDLDDALTIDFNGQQGGDGGTGQAGGNGGRGMGGQIGKSDTSWPGSGCDRAPGSGGAGGNGGDGGTGGNGGGGGAAGSIGVCSTADNISSSPLVSGQITFVNDGAAAGGGGLGGEGGAGGIGGNPGNPTSECGPAATGPGGSDGTPAPGVGAGQLNMGSTGTKGAPNALTLEALPSSGTCADLLPMPVTVSGALNPAHFCRGFNTGDTYDAMLSGEYFTQVTSASCSLSGVTVNVLNSSTDTELDLEIDIAPNSATGSGDLILHRAFGADFTLSGALMVDSMIVNSVMPVTGAQNSSVAVTIAGSCFDTMASIQQVSVSGVGVNVVNVLVVDENTITCTFQLDPLTAPTARDVTVKTGSRTYTLTGAFTPAESPVQITGTLMPSHMCRGYSTGASYDATLTGQFLSQVSGVDCSLAGVTVTVQLTSTDTELDLNFNLAGNATTGMGNLTLHSPYNPDFVINNAVEVDSFIVNSVTPASGAHGTQVAVTIAGSCFDSTAAIQQVSVSGVSVTVLNVLVVDPDTITCVFQIDALAAQTARDVTVKTGSFSYTLLSGFTVT